MLSPTKSPANSSKMSSGCSEDDNDHCFSQVGSDAAGVLKKMELKPEIGLGTCASGCSSASVLLCSGSCRRGRSQ